MKNIRRIIIGVLAIVMSASLLYGCASKPASTSPAATSAQGSASAPATASSSASGSESEVYTMENRIPWSTVTAAVTASRANLNKAIKASNKKDKVKIGYVTWTTGTPFFAAMMDTVKSEGAKHGYDVIVTVSDSSVDKQLAAIENFVTMGVDVIIDNSMDVNAETPAIKSAVAAGVPVIGLGLAFPASVPVITTLGVNYYEQGFELGKYYADQVKGKDVKGATIPGMIGHTIAESKLNGFLGGFCYERAIQLGKPYATKEDAMLAGYKLEQSIAKSASCSAPDLKFQIVTSIDGSWTQEGGLKAAEDIVTAHPDINLMFADNDQEGFGAIKAMQQAGMKVGTDVQVVSVGDGTKECMQMIKNGQYLAVDLASPYTEAKGCVDLVYKIFGEGFDATNLPAETDLENVVCTKDNADQYLKDTEFATLNDAVFKPIG